MKNWYENGDILKKLYVFLITYCKRFHPKSSLYGKVKMTTREITVLQSFINIGSFNCDHTLLLTTTLIVFSLEL